MTIEEQIARGRVTYIHALGYDAHRAQLVILLLDSPEGPVGGLTLIFRGVRGFRDDWHDDQPAQDDDGDLVSDSVIGFDVYPGGGRTEYVICTEHREIGFVTEVAPEIIERTAT